MPIPIQRCLAVVAIPMALSLSGCVRQVEVSDGQYTLFTNWSLIEEGNTTPKKLWNLVSTTGADLESKAQERCPTSKACQDIQERLNAANQAQSALAPLKENTTKIPTISYRTVEIEPSGNSQPKPVRTAYCLPESVKGITKTQLEQGILWIQGMKGAKSTTGPLFRKMDKAVCSTFE